MKTSQSCSPLVRLALLGFLTLPFLAASQARADLSAQGLLTARLVSVESQPSWISGGFGRLQVGADGPGQSESHFLGKAQAMLDWQPGEIFGAYVHVTARAEPDEHQGRSLGLVEGYAYAAIPLRQQDELEIRLGHFFLPTSRENVDPGWSSPYTLTLSALNTWIAEEVRPTGLLAQYTLGLPNSDELRTGLSLFGGNDSQGAILAWRGWSLGDRLTTYGETLPLPPLDSLTSGPFAEQRSDGSQPFGSDLDSRPGWASYLRWQRPARFSLQATWMDNRGDRSFPKRDEYAWRTRFALLSADWRPSDRWTFAAEAMDGNSGMGPRDGIHAQIDFRTYYFLSSWATERLRLSLRYDHFDIEDRDQSPEAEANQEDGKAWTAALFWNLRRDVRLGLEYVLVEGDRPAAAQSGFLADTDGESLTFELRYRLGG